MASKAAVQLYTLRDYTKTATDLVKTLEKCRAIGYEAAQFSAVGAMSGDSPQVTAKEAKRMLDDHGMKCVATHRGWEDLAKKTEQEIEFHHALGCNYAAIGGLPGVYREKKAEGFRKFLEESEPVIAKLKEAGIAFGYHNHAHELERYAPGPKTLLDIFIDEGGIDFTLELDTYWAVHGGADPIVILERCFGRVPVIHVKDKEVVGNEPVMCPIGEGNLNWDGIIAAGEKAGVQWYAVEQDTCRRDPFDCLKSSFEFLTSKGL
jgi:sugar phosphate isomerase/epimerase